MSCAEPCSQLEETSSTLQGGCWALPMEAWALVIGLSLTACFVPIALLSWCSPSLCMCSRSPAPSISKRPDCYRSWQAVCSTATIKSNRKLYPFHPVGVHQCFLPGVISTHCPKEGILECPTHLSPSLLSCIYLIKAYSRCF